MPKFLRYLTGSVILLVLVFSAFTYYFFVLPQKLSTDDLLKRGYVRTAIAKAIRRYKEENSEEAKRRLIRTYLLAGNIARARLLADIYDIDDELLIKVNRLQQQVVKQRKEEARVENPFISRKLGELRGYPVYGNLKFFVGYQLALTGDWHGARSYLKEAKRDGVSQVLSPYLEYYLARAYLIKGDDAEKREGKIILEKLSRSSKPWLRARALINIMKIHLDEERLEEALNCLKELETVALYGSKQADWIFSKAHSSLADYLLEHDQPVSATKHYLQALNTSSPSAQKKAINALLSVLRNSDKSQLAQIESRIFVSLLELGRNAKKYGLADETEEVLRALLSKSDTNSPIRFFALAGLIKLYLEGGKTNKAVKLLAQLENKTNVDNKQSKEILQELLVEAGESKWKEGSFSEAESLLKDAIDLGGRKANLARLTLFRLIRNKFPFSRINDQISLLTQIADGDSKERVEALEELLPLLIYRGQADKAKRYISKLNNIEPSLAMFWQNYLKDSQQARDEPKIAKFNYYEISLVDKVDWESLSHLTTNKSPFEIDQNEEEYLFSIFAIELGMELLDGLKNGQRKTIGVATMLATQRLVDDVHKTSWEATKFVESGEMREVPEEILEFILQTAFPTPFISEVENAIEHAGLPSSMVYAVMKKESNFSINAVSPSGAIGLMQIMPSTAILFEKLLPPEIKSKSLVDPAKNIYIGSLYLAEQRRVFGQDFLAYCAYNAGPGNLRSWLKLIGNEDRTLFIELIPSYQTKQFVKKVYKYQRIYEFILSLRSVAEK